MEQPKKRATQLLIKVVNLEDGRPTVPLALSLLADTLRIARREGFAGVKLIHGYGSSGEGGAIRIAVQKELTRMMASRQIDAFISGEDWRISNEASWGFLQAHPECKQDRDLGRANKGISIVLF